MWLTEFYHVMFFSAAVQVKLKLELLTKRKKSHYSFYCGIYDQYKIKLTLRPHELVLSEG